MKDNPTVTGEEQWQVPSSLGDLIKPEHSLEQIIEAVYQSVNQLMDAYPFSVGLYDASAMTITVRTIHRNAYHQHRLYILKTVGDFIVRCIAPE